MQQTFVESYYVPTIFLGTPTAEDKVPAFMQLTIL